ncbi:MAG: hypothetical protein RIC55_00850 [Pirellulaceae bacterium]
MPERTRDITLHLTWSEHGTPIASIADDARIRLSVHSAESKRDSDPSLPPQIGSVSIEGNRAGLVALAEQLLAIAYTEIEGYHQHFDDEVPANFLDAEGNWELIVGRNDSRSIRRAVAAG